MTLSWESNQLVPIISTCKDHGMAKPTKGMASEEATVNCSEWQNGSSLKIVFLESLELTSFWRFCKEKPENKDRY